MIAGRATPEGTRRFEARSAVAPGHFREAMAGLSLSSIGLGTYLGREDAATDRGLRGVRRRGARARGVNVFDSAINYRGQRSERAIGRALAAAFAEGRRARDEVFVSTKGGLPSARRRGPAAAPAGTSARPSSSPGLAPAAEVAQGCHCMAPGYLEDQIARSRDNLGLETIDLYYLHNVETQLDERRPRTLSRRRLAAAIETLERASRDGKIAAWGLATWDGLRVPPEHPEHLSMATRARPGGRGGGAVPPLPGGPAPGQSRHGPRRRATAPRTSGATRMSALEAAAALGLAAFGSASLLQGRLVAELPEEIDEAFPEATLPARRGAPVCPLGAGNDDGLVGVSTPAHAADDFALAKVPPGRARPGRLGLFS